MANLNLMTMGMDYHMVIQIINQQHDYKRMVKVLILIMILTLLLIVGYLHKELKQEIGRI